MSRERGILEGSENGAWEKEELVGKLNKGR
jgi:hypothetical protein